MKIKISKKELLDTLLPRIEGRCARCSSYPVVPSDFEYVVLEGEVVDEEVGIYERVHEDCGEIKKI